MSSTMEGSEIRHNQEAPAETQGKSNDSNMEDSEIHHNEEASAEIQGQSNDVVDESHSNNEFIFTDGTLVWIPDVDSSLIHDIGMVFENLEAGITWYEKYASMSGFDIRRSTQRRTLSGLTTAKYFICNRAGLPNTTPLDTLDPTKNKKVRNSSSHRTKCPAFVGFKAVECSDQVFLWRFEQRHNHELIHKDLMHLSRERRQLGFVEQSFIHKMSNSKVGAKKAYKLMCTMKGGYEYVAGTETDWNNYMKDINCHIGGSDAQMLIEKLQNLKENVINFSYEYRCDNKQLNALFWADDTSKLNYEEFGDVVSFDATYRTNRYCMVFVPFTGIDNHRRCVTFGAGLLCREDIDSYVWLLKAFLNCFGKQPIMVLTDQDPAMKKAIEMVLPNSRHRFCMWHITSKLPLKVPWETMNSGFKGLFNNLVWETNIDEKDFEERWNALMVEYNLKDDKWMRDMFDLRRSWISAFFRHVPMSGLMRTTSRSESENSVFNKSSHRGYTLMNFMNSFESAMEKQRRDQIKLDFHTTTTIPVFKTPLVNLEKHASMVYTRKIFLTVQNGILHSLLSCSQKSVTVGVVSDICIIREKKTNASVNKMVHEHKEDDDMEFQWNLDTREAELEVEFNKVELTMRCGCMFFEQFGILCRHVFCVLKLYDIHEIPSRYILRRWRRDIIPTELLKRRFIYSDSSENVDKVAYDVFCIVDQCLSALRNNDKDLQHFLQKVKTLKKETDELCLDKFQHTKQGTIEHFYGATKPVVVEIENPTIAKNKGSGTGKRLKSALEKATIQAKKQQRSCKTCGIQGHNSRKCPQKNASKE